MPRGSSEIRSAGRDFISLVEKGTGLVAENEARLPAALDRLAFAQSLIRFEFDDADYVEPVGQDEAELRSLAMHRFPSLGYYNIPEFVTQKVGESICVVGDAIDDIVDITTELLAVEWRWAHTSEADALWHLRHGFESHWRAHLRGLQLYLAALAGGE